jgi:hypothetical protein
MRGVTVVAADAEGVGAGGEVDMKAVVVVEIMAGEVGEAG